MRHNSTDSDTHHIGKCGYGIQRQLASEFLKAALELNNHLLVRHSDLHRAGIKSMFRCGDKKLQDLLPFDERNKEEDRCDVTTTEPRSAEDC